jgi:hypothetical protein
MTTGGSSSGSASNGDPRLGAGIGLTVSDADSCSAGDEICASLVGVASGMELNDGLGGRGGGRDGDGGNSGGAACITGDIVVDCARVGTLAGVMFSRMFGVERPRPGRGLEMELCECGVLGPEPSANEI